MPDQRDFSTISPSAKSLLLVKSQTSLPFARAASELLWGAEYVEQGVPGSRRDLRRRERRRHFEIRAQSLHEALHELGASRVLEIAAGLSFRGLAMASCGDVFYLDTDLPRSPRSRPISWRSSIRAR
jgi:hypothetical protein